MRVIVGLGLCFLCGLAVLGVVLVSETPQTPNNTPAHIPASYVSRETIPANDPPAQRVRAESGGLFIGKNYSGMPRQIHTVLSTRKGDARYQMIVRYMPKSVPQTEIPGYTDVLKALSGRGKSLARDVMLMEQETETWIESLGEPVRSIVSYRAYVNPVDGHVVAYDLAQTSGGQPQRYIGHITRGGLSLEIYRGSELVDRNELPFSTRETFIPVEMEFIHQWYQANPESLKKREMVNFQVFSPETLSTVLLVVRPLDDQTIPVGDATYECAHYEALAVSTLAQGGLHARQEFWYDKKTGLLMKRQDFEPSLKPSDAPVTERTTLEALRNMSHLIVRPEPLPERQFPHALGEEVVYKITARDEEVGRARIKFSLAGAEGKRDPEIEYVAETNLTLKAKGMLRQEKATTFFDKQWRPVKYVADGEEGAAERSHYQLSAEFKGDQLSFNVKRQTQRSGPESVTAASPKHALLSEDEKDWRDPLQRVSLAEDDPAEAKPAARHTIDQTLKRTLSPGTYLYDFNRVEHLLAAAFRLPFPKVPENPQTKCEPAYQRLALFSLRQNLAGVLPYEIKPEVKPVLTERQKRRLTKEEREEPQLYVANTTAALLPSKLLLTPEGRVLELTLKYGTMDLLFTLDDPITRRRAERHKKQRLMEGPRLLRPEWW